MVELSTDEIQVCVIRTPSRLSLGRTWSRTTFLGVMLCVWVLLHTHTATLSSPMKQPNTVRYSLTAAVTECSEWTADNAISSSTCCLCTHTHTCTGALIISEPRLLLVHVSALSQLFHPGTVHRLKDRSKVRGCGCVCKKWLWPTSLPPARSHFFYFQSKPLWVYLYMRLRCFMKNERKHRPSRQCGGLCERKQIFVPLPATGNCSYTHRTPFSSHTHALTHRLTQTSKRGKCKLSVERHFVHCAYIFARLAFI